jgi:hypothetical protein
MCGGNAAMAADRLRDVGLEIPERTLRHWQTATHRERYAELCQGHARQLDDLITRQAREAAISAAEVEQRAWRLQMEQLEEGKVRDPSAVARNAAVSKAINIDKTLLLEGRPTQITEHRDIGEIVRSLDSIAPGLVVDGTGEDA